MRLIKNLTPFFLLKRRLIPQLLFPYPTTSPIPFLPFLPSFSFSLSSSPVAAFPCVRLGNAPVAPSCCRGQQLAAAEIAASLLLRISSAAIPSPPSSPASPVPLAVAARDGSADNPARRHHIIVVALFFPRSIAAAYLPSSALSSPDPDGSKHRPSASYAQQPSSAVCGDQA